MKNEIQTSEELLRIMRRIHKIADDKELQESALLRSIADKVGDSAEALQKYSQWKIKKNQK